LKKARKSAIINIILEAGAFSLGVGENKQTGEKRPKIQKRPVQGAEKTETLVSATGVFVKPGRKRFPRPEETGSRAHSTTEEPRPISAASGIFLYKG